MIDDNIGYWDFVEAYYPNYYSCEEILISDILSRKLGNEEICPEDEEWITGLDVKKTLFELDRKILNRTLTAYFKKYSV